MEIRKREKFLLDRLDMIRNRKVAVLESQCADLKVAQTSMKNMTEQLTLCSNNGHEMIASAFIKTTNDAMESLKGQCSIFLCLSFDSKLFEENIAHSNLVGFCQKWHSNFIFVTFRF